MTTKQELTSWFFPGSVDVKGIPQVNNTAPSVSEISFPRKDGKPVVIAFLRHCGCPWAEKTFRTLRHIAADNNDIQCVAVSHSDESATKKWLESVGGAGNIQVVVDDQRRIYGEYGLGIASFWHVLNPWSLANVITLGRAENIWNRPTESGTRWQTAGIFAVDSQGKVRYSHPAEASDDMGDLNAAIQSVKTAAKL